MRRIAYLCLLLGLSVPGPMPGWAFDPVAARPVQPGWRPGETPEQHDARMAWWQEAFPPVTARLVRFFKDEPKPPQFSDFELFPSL